MKLQPSAVTVVLFLLTAAGAADAQEMQPSDAASHSSSQQSISSSQRAMDGDSTWDYGAQPGGRNGYGKTRDGQPCVVGLSCDIYQGS